MCHGRWRRLEQCSRATPASCFAAYAAQPLRSARRQLQQPFSAEPPTPDNTGRAGQGPPRATLADRLGLARPALASCHQHRPYLPRLPRRFMNIDAHVAEALPSIVSMPPPHFRANIRHDFRCISHHAIFSAAVAARRTIILVNMLASRVGRGSTPTKMRPPWVVY